MTLQMVKLGDVADFIRGITFKPGDVVLPNAEDAVICMRTKNVQAMLDCEDLLAIPSNFVKRKDQFLREGDILVSSANSWNLVGKCCWIPALSWAATFGGFVSVLRGDAQRVDRRYLYWWFASERIQALLRSFGQRTTNISNLNIERCLQLDLPLPSLSEQRRIAAILDKAEALRTKRREALAQLDRLAQSIFVEMFGDPVSNPKGFRKQPIGDVTEISTGSTPSRGSENFYGGDIPWIKTTEVDGSEILDTEEKLTQAGLKAIRGKLHPVNSIVVAMYGQGQTRGRCALLRIEASCNQACGVIKPSKEFEPWFMFAQLLSSYERIRALGRGGNQENLNLQLLGSFEVLLPPMHLQQNFVIRLSSIETLKYKHRRALDELDNLFNSLQYRAFLGKL